MLLSLVTLDGCSLCMEGTVTKDLRASASLSYTEASSSPRCRFVTINTLKSSYDWIWPGNLFRRVLLLVGVSLPRFPHGWLRHHLYHASRVCPGLGHWCHRFVIYWDFYFLLTWIYFQEKLLSPIPNYIRSWPRGAPSPTKPSSSGCSYLYIRW